MTSKNDDKPAVTVPATGDSLGGAPETGGQLQAVAASPADAGEPEPLPDVPPKGKVRLFTQGAVSHVNVDDVTITQHGADVTPEQAARAHEAAALAGYKLREEVAAPSK